jgi:hypothetical protein
MWFIERAAIVRLEGAVPIVCGGVHQRRDQVWASFRDSSGPQSLLHEKK